MGSSIFNSKVFKVQDNIFEVYLKLIFVYPNKHEQTVGTCCSHLVSTCYHTSSGKKKQTKALGERKNAKTKGFVLV